MKSSNHNDTEKGKECCDYEECKGHNGLFLSHCDQCNPSPSPAGWGDVDSKFSDQFFAATQGRNDIRRAQIKETLARHDAELVEKVSAERAKWTKCEDPLCTNKKGCEVANHYIEKIWEPAFDRIIHLLKGE